MKKDLERFSAVQKKENKTEILYLKGISKANKTFLSTQAKIKAITTAEYVNTIIESKRKLARTLKKKKKVQSARV